MQYLLAGIKTNEMDSVHVQIMANLDLQESYDKCVDLYQDYIVQNHTTNHAYNVSEVGTSKKGGLKRHVNFSDENGDIKVNDCYSIPKEYVTLTSKQKVKLKMI